MYIKRTLKFHEKLPSPLAGIVYQQASLKEPLSVGDLVERTHKYFTNHPQEGYHNRGTIRKVVELLVQLGYLQSSD
jgi:hypothetical protein